MKLKFDIFNIIWLLVFALILVNIAGSLHLINSNFKVVQELQKDVNHLNDITSCLEPARP